MSVSRRGPRILYVVYWGAAEPLGQALVLPAVERLQTLGAQVTLVTFDKIADLADRAGIDAIQRRLENLGVEWISRRYHRRPHLPAKLLDLGVGVVACLLAARTETDVVQARTFFGGVMVWLVAPLLRAKIVYHAEGFYPEEMVDGGAWPAGSIRYRLARWIEDRVYRRANAVIVLSNAAKDRIDALFSASGSAKAVVVVPSVVDLARFRAQPAKKPGDPIRLVYSGSIGYRYVFDRAARFAAIMEEELKQVSLRILTRTDVSVVAGILNGSGLSPESWSVASVPFAEVPAELSAADAGLCFGTQRGSETGGSPTKVGEYWASGLPVVVTPNVGDVDAIVRAERVGVVVEGVTEDAYRRAARGLKELLCDPGLPERCRKAAERHYALEPACQTQMELYKSLIGREVDGL